MEVRFEDIKEMRQSAVRLMPEGLQSLGEDGLRDVLTYLTTRRESSPHAPRGAP